MRALLVFSSLFLAACGGMTLDGSVNAQAPLEFNDVVLRKQSQVFLLQYHQRTGEAAQIVLKLAVDIEGLPPSKALKDEAFLEHVSVSRVMHDGTRFPSIRHGTLVFERLKFEHRGPANGYFAILFSDSTTVNGTFAGTLTEVLE